MRKTDIIIAHLDREYTRPVRDPLWKHIYLSDGLMSLIDTPEFQQLNRIKQLGPSYLVYPGATHTRLNHSLGVFHIARRMIRALAALDNFPQLSLEGVRAFLAACLLHDVGHFPYTHSMKELPLREHENLTGEIMLRNPIRSRLKDDVGCDPEMAAAIVDLDAPDGGNPEIAFFRKLLSGTLDPDKLDYLNRDAYFCGVPYGLQDIDYAISRMVPNGYEGVALDETGISAVENLLFSKYLMYRAVYWHRTVRVATAMIKKAIYLALTDGAIRSEDLYGLDDELFFIRFAEMPYPAFDLVRGVYTRRLHSPVAALAFDAGLPRHRALTSLEERTGMETELARDLSARSGRRIEPTDIILDVPERVSFEISYPIREDGRMVDFPDSHTVFTPQTVARFTSTLRRVRLMVAREHLDLIPDPDALLRDFLQ